MVHKGTTGWMTAVASLFFAAVLTTAPLHAQTPQELQTELQQMRQLYERQIAALEARIAALEKQNTTIAAATQQSTVSVTDLQRESAAAKQEAPGDRLTRDERTQIAQEELANTPRYDLVRDAEQRIAALTEQVKL